jgi:hypothetical protein
MKPGWYMRDGMKVVQKMVDGGKNIGIKKVLEARGLWPEGKFLLKCKDGCAPGRTDCCARTLLANQPDFLEQECALAECLRKYNETNGTNHLIDFLPKFHPELNPIERYWASLKRMLRNDPAGSAAKHRAALRQALVGGVPGVEFGRYFLRCLRVCSAYRLDCSYALANFVTNKYRGHRGIPADAVMDKIVAECAAKLQVNPEVLLSPVPPPPAHSEPPELPRVPAAAPPARPAVRERDGSDEMVDDEKQQIMDNMPDPEDREALRDWHLARRLQREDANAAVNQRFVPVPLAPNPHGLRRSSRKRKALAAPAR